MIVIVRSSPLPKVAVFFLLKSHKILLIKEISPDGIGRSICCNQFSQDSLIVMCVPDRFNNGDGSVVFLTVDEDTKIDFSFSTIDYCFGFPFGICESMDTIYVSDYGNIVSVNLMLPRRPSFKSLVHTVLKEKKMPR